MTPAPDNTVLPSEDALVGLGFDTPHDVSTAEVRPGGAIAGIIGVCVGFGALVGVGVGGVMALWSALFGGAGLAAFDWILAALP